MAATTLITVLLTGSAAVAEPLGAPEGPVLLEVTGEVGRTNRGGAMVFDRAMLEQLPRTRFTTTTIWTDGAHTFTGVALDDLLDAVEADGTTLRATALNDYDITMPIAAAEDGPLVAYAMDGTAMSVRDKGPLWIVYPYDAAPAYRTETIYTRSIWQLRRIHVSD